MEENNSRQNEESREELLEELQKQMAGITLGNPDSCEGKLAPILSNPVLFGLNLVEAGLSNKIEGMFRQLIAGPGAVRKTLHEYMK